LESLEDIWVYDVARESLLQLTFDARLTNYPIWTPDGERVVFFSFHEGRRGFFAKSANGTGRQDPLATFDTLALWTPWSITPDGRTVLYHQLTPDTGWDIGSYSLDEALPGELFSTKYGETAPQISRDGRWLAYVSDETGQNEIYVRPFPNVDEGKWRVSRGGGVQPVWSRDGSELFYAKDNSLLSVAIGTTPTFVASSPRVLFSGPYRQWRPGAIEGHTYDVSPDGRSFLMIREAEEVSAANEFVVIQNWFEELKRLVPGEN
jgi:serine/threonine-protein kinase